MNPNVDQLQFYSGHPIDKVVYTLPNDDELPITIVNSGATSNDPQVSLITTNTYPNPYGEKCFVRYVWSIDGINFNASTSHLVYTFTITDTTIPFTTDPILGLRAAVAVGVSDTAITVLTGNGYHGNVDFDGVDYTYTPISQTFTIKLALFTLE